MIPTSRPPAAMPVCMRREEILGRIGPDHGLERRGHHVEAVVPVGIEFVTVGAGARDDVAAERDRVSVGRVAGGVVAGASSALISTLPMASAR